MSKKPQFKSEIFIASVGMLIVSWHETTRGNFVVDDIEGEAGHSQNCLTSIPGFMAMLSTAIARKTQQIKSARNVKFLSPMQY
jgi:hypothetical protein